MNTGSSEKHYCIGVKTSHFLFWLEVGDFRSALLLPKDFPASYLGLVPGEDSSGSDDQNRLGITKGGNRHVRLLLTEASQCKRTGWFQTKELKSRQSGIHLQDHRLC